MKVLLHTCCAPCLIYPWQKLRDDNYQMTSFFYNPNIHPYLEYRERLSWVQEYCLNNQIDLMTTIYDPAIYLRQVVFRETEPERCRICYQIRLGETARVALKRGFDFFTSTLLVSPHQKYNLIQEIAEEVSKEQEIPFLNQDFREGYKKGVTQSRELGMYRQKYCGCIFSERERYQPKG